MKSLEYQKQPPIAAWKFSCTGKQAHAGKPKTVDPKEQLDELQMTPAGMLTLEQLLEVIMARVSNGIFVAFTEDDGFQMVSDDHSTGIEILGLLSMGESRLNAAVFDAPEDEDDERGY